MPPPKQQQEEEQRFPLLDLSAAKKFMQGACLQFLDSTLVSSLTSSSQSKEPRRTRDGFELHMGTNYLGQYLLVRSDFLHKSFIIIGTLWIWLFNSQTSSSPAEENCQGEFDRERSRWKKIDKKDWAIGNLCISGKVQIVVLASQTPSKGLKEERLRLEDLNWYLLPHNILE